MAEFVWRSRGYLPHLTVARGSYAVTFRLADSMPREVRDGWAMERENALAEAQARLRPATDDELATLRKYFSERVEAYLDSGIGECWMRRPEVAHLVAHGLRHFDGARYQLFAWVVMPNHVHALLKPLGEWKLRDILHSWKSWTAGEANRMLGRKGEPFWQKESYDHWIRDLDDFRHSAEYIENNPVAARLCARPEDWRWSSAWRASEAESNLAGRDAGATA